MYKALVTPILTYCSYIWSPYYDVDIDLLESVQHKFLRYAAYKANSPMSFDNHDFSLISRQLNFYTMKSLHDFYDMQFVFNSFNSKIKFDALTNIFKKKRGLIVSEI